MVMQIKLLLLLLLLHARGEGNPIWHHFKKKFPASACRKKKIACSTNVIEKNSCAAVRKKKNVAKLFHHSGGLYKIAAKLQPFSRWKVLTGQTRLISS